jgi:hypothetical protein
MALSVREPPRKTGDHGTLLKPNPVGLEVDGLTRLRTRLGYEAIPSSDFWCFTVNRDTELRVDRVSDDIYAVHVGVALIDQHNMRVAPLVQTQDGHGDWVRIKPGYYKIVASLGMPEEVAVELQVQARHPRVPLWGIGIEMAPGTARLFLPRARAIAWVGFGASAFMNHERPGSRGTAFALLQCCGWATMRSAAARSTAIGTEAAPGIARLSSPSKARLDIYALGLARLRTVHPKAVGTEAAPGIAHLRGSLVALGVEDAPGIAHMGVQSGGRLRGIGIEMAPGLARLAVPARAIGVEPAQGLAHLNADLGSSAPALAALRYSPLWDGRLRGISSTVLLAAATMRDPSISRPPPQRPPEQGCAYDPPPRFVP